MVSETPTQLARTQLTPRQAQFVEAYLQCWNGAEAARRAGYTKKNARHAAQDVLTSPHVRAVVTRELGSVGITREAILERLAAIFFGANVGDFEDFVTGKKTLKQLEASGVDLRALKSFSVSMSKQGLTRRVELHDGLTAAGQMERILGLIVDRHVVATRMEDLSHLGDGELRRMAAVSGVDDEAKVV